MSAIYPQTKRKVKQVLIFDLSPLTPQQQLTPGFSTAISQSRLFGVRIRTFQRLRKSLTYKKNTDSHQNKGQEDGNQRRAF